MGIPRDADARKYYRVAKQRLEDAELLQREKIERYAASIYLAGYVIECVLKSLLLHTTRKNRPEMRRALKEDFGHNLRRLHDRLTELGLSMPKNISGNLLFVASWSPELRYEPGPGNPTDAKKFLSCAKAIVEWADGRM